MHSYIYIYIYITWVKYLVNVSIDTHEYLVFVSRYILKYLCPALISTGR